MESSASPIYAYSSGPVGDAINSVQVSDVATYDPEGELMMLTVSSQEVNPFEALVAGFDPDVDLVPRDAVRPPDESIEDFVARNRANDGPVTGDRDQPGADPPRLSRS